MQEVTEITTSLKALAKELNVPIIALSQLSRQVESRDDKRPQLSDLRESGSIEQDADVVMFVYREEYYLQNKEPRIGTPEHEKWQLDMSLVHGKAEVIIGKQRHGPTGTVELQFEGQFTRFSDLAQDSHLPDADLLTAAARLNRRGPCVKCGMNIVPDPKSIPPGTVLSPEANQAAALATATGVLTVDLDAIVANWRKLEKTAVPAECAGVVKADAYGCGAEPVARALAAAGCKTFFVATLDEARAVRAAAPTAAIYVLDGFFQNSGDAFAKIDCQAGDRRSQRTRRMGRVLPPLRLGRRRRDPHRHRHEPARPDDRRGAGHRAADQRRRSRHHAGDEPPRLRRDCSTIRSTPGSSRPFARSPACFPACRRRCRTRPASFSAPQFQFDLVRPGAALYGINPTPEADNPMQPVVELKARIVQIRNVERGDTVGYGGTWTARRPTRLAIVSAGYADGYFRAAGSNDGTRGAEVMVAGKRCPIAGRISMDLIAVDVTDLRQERRAARPHGDADRRRHHRRRTRAIISAPSATKC